MREPITAAEGLRAAAWTLYTEANELQATAEAWAKDHYWGCAERTGTQSRWCCRIADSLMIEAERLETKVSWAHLIAHTYGGTT